MITIFTTMKLAFICLAVVTCLFVVFTSIPTETLIKAFLAFSLILATIGVVSIL